MFYLTLAFLANSVANVLLKIGADRGVFLDFSAGIVRLLYANVYSVAGIALFAVNVCFYIAALRGLPLSFAYPIMVGMTFLITNSAAILLLHEPVGWQHILGYVLILGGITLVVTYAQ